VQQVERHRLGVVGAEQPLALLSELGEAAALARNLGFRLPAHPCHRRAKRSLEIAERDEGFARFVQIPSG
jgi:hypothetical protein